MNAEQVEGEEDFKVLSVRMKNVNWQVRKRAYQAIFQCLQEVSSLKDEFKINSEVFTALKLTAILNNLTQEKHPILVLKGLDCVLRIISLSHSATKYFNQLVAEGLEKFPQLTQQRKQVLEKFMEILYFFKEDQNIVATLNSKLSLLNEKAVMWVIQVIGALEVVSLKKKLIEMSRKHPKQDVRELAAEIADQLGDEMPSRKKEQVVNVKPTSKPAMSKKQDPRRVTELLEKMHHYDQMPAKKQQEFTVQLLQGIEEIVGLPMTPQLVNFSYFIQLMIQDNNQIISTNGVKVLTVLIRLRSQLLPVSFPLLFVFRKFKMHKTHATNANLFKLVQTLLCSNRCGDLMAAIYEGMNLADNKANIKYGCYMSFLRVFCYYYRDDELFAGYCLGEYEDLFERIENKKGVEKMLGKCAEVFCRDKDRDYANAIGRVRNRLRMSVSGVNQQNVGQRTPNDVKSVSRSKKQTVNDPIAKTQPVPKSSLSSKAPKNRSSFFVSPEGVLNKILELTEGGKCSQSVLRKSVDKCLECLSICIVGQAFDMFFYCEIVQGFIEEYQSVEEWDEIISVFLIDYLKIVSELQIKPEKRTSRLVQKGMQELLKISITQLALGKELLVILNRVNNSVGYETVLKCLGGLLVMEGESVKKKNKKYLIRWLQENTPEEFIGNEYFELREALEQKTKEKTMEPPPSIMAIPKYSELKAETAHTFRGEKNVIKNVANPSVEGEIQTKNIKNFSRQQTRFQKEPLETFKQQKEEVRPQRLDMFENADISHIEKVEEAESDRLDQKWQYFLNKKGIAKSDLTSSPKPETKQIPCSQQQKYDFSQQQHISQLKESHQYQFGESNNSSSVKQAQKSGEILKHNFQLDVEEDKGESGLEEKKVYQKQEDLEQQSVKRYYEPQEESRQQGEQKSSFQIVPQKFKYVYLDEQRINYMLNNSGKSFSHLRTLVLCPFKKQPNKQAFLREFTHLIQSQQIKKPEPYKSLLLLIITLFSEIRNDKSIIEPLQFLYQFMAQRCSNNQFLKIIIGLYHCVIEQSEEGDRKLLLTILAKSMIRIMPYVEDALELLKDFQQFYQIGELVYFEMYPEEYSQIRQVLQKSDSLEQVIAKACEDQGEGIVSIIEGWLDTAFKVIVRAQIDEFLSEVQEEVEA